MRAVWKCTAQGNGVQYVMIPLIPMTVELCVDNWDMTFHKTSTTLLCMSFCL